MEWGSQIKRVLDELESRGRKMLDIKTYADAVHGSWAIRFVKTVN